MALNFQQLGMLAKLKSAFSTFQQSILNLCLLFMQ